MDSYWMISGFLGHKNDFYKFEKVSKILTQNSVRNTGNFAGFSWPTESLFERFRNFPHPPTCGGVWKITKPFKK